MNKTKHTPGPWTLERVPIQSVGGSNTAWKIGPFQCCIYDDWRNRKAGLSEEEIKASAYLIAAAPDLLAALEEITTMTPIPGSIDEYKVGQQHALSACREIARVAIAKAKGTP